ncbi:NERD domain-containing protein [Butyrivibrio sp. YAB3001]|uniref:NERD domain-containing protein n=1 Tax=Butyrivibrio sp. YAB3001 TaxID=1520812 RepID=UPI0008F64BD5|nr:NERD domain-containing protein [Butyrivibrio sp. YAB3001]SFD02946.1 hypothetical protein SAMN02910398_03836 [Butyrivibrio sp. YAB3001]
MDNIASKRKMQILKDFKDSKIMTDAEYSRTEVVPELLKFQNMIVSKVFEENHGENLRISDVKAHINSIAEDKGIISDEKVQEFNALTDELSKLIACEISGIAGEKKMQHNLDMIQVKNEHLANIELRKDEYISECDGIVVTSKAIFLLEAKYSICDMSITTEGNYCRADNEEVVLCNIGDKVNEKDYLIRDVLKNNGFLKGIKIYNIVVNANNNTKLYNHYGRYLKTCFCNQIHYIIEDFQGDDIYTEDDIRFITNRLLEASEVKKYPIDFDFERYKNVFTDVLVMTESESDENQDDDASDIEVLDWKRLGKDALILAAFTALGVMTAIAKHGGKCMKTGTL